MDFRIGDSPFSLPASNRSEMAAVFPGKTRRIHQSFEDPPAPGAGDDDHRLAIFRRVRDEMREWLKSFVREHQGVSGRPPKPSGRS